MKIWGKIVGGTAGLALGGPIAALDAEEGRTADVVNVRTVGRSWDLWKQRVMK